MKMIRLSCAVQTYAWGKLGTESTVAQLAELNGDVAADSETTYAEYWFGTHQAGPASVRVSDGQCISLAAWLKQNQETALGDLPNRSDCNMTDVSCGLPYLAKVLSVAKCLSIQAHPDKALAEKLHAERPEIYKDSNHKPEMALALTPFEAMCGFRSVSEILHFINTVPEFRAVLLWQGENGDGSEAIKSLREAAAARDVSSEPPSADTKVVVASALKNLFNIYANANPTLVAVEVNKLTTRIGKDAPGFLFSPHGSGASDPSGLDLAEGLAVRLAGQFPGDIGVFAPFLLNFLRLKPGEAIFLAANEPHAYVSGDCFEVMANSNNVVRMGCTPKLRDVPVLTEMLTFSSGLPNILTGESLGENIQVYTPTDPQVTEFQLERIIVNAGGECSVPEAKTPSILIVVEGAGVINDIQVSKGQVYMQPAKTNLNFTVPIRANAPCSVFRVHCRE